MAFNCDWNCINIHLKHHPTSPLNPSLMPFFIRYITHAECVSYRAKYHPIINLIRHFCCFHLNFFKFSTWGPFIVKNINSKDRPPFQLNPSSMPSSIQNRPLNTSPIILDHHQSNNKEYSTTHCQPNHRDLPFFLFYLTLLLLFWVNTTHDNSTLHSRRLLSMIIMTHDMLINDRVLSSLPFGR